MGPGPKLLNTSEAVVCTRTAHSLHNAGPPQRWLAEWCAGGLLRPTQFTPLRLEPHRLEKIKLAPADIASPTHLQSAPSVLTRSLKSVSTHSLRL